MILVLGQVRQTSHSESKFYHWQVVALDLGLERRAEVGPAELVERCHKDTQLKELSKLMLAARAEQEGKRMRAWGNS